MIDKKLKRRRILKLKNIRGGPPSQRAAITKVHHR